jgi:uncharacterized membrane protein YkoI
MKRRIAATAVVAAAALAATGGAVAFAGDVQGGGDGAPQQTAHHGTGTGTGSSVRLNDGDEDTKEAKAARTTAAEAADTARGAVQGTVTGVDLDNDRQGLVWEADAVRGGTSYEVVLDAGTGKVLTRHKDDEADRETPPTGARVSATDAARKAVGHGTVTSVELEDNGTWEVETIDKRHHEHGLAVDPHSGKVTPLPSDDEDDADD